jgi:HAD superfamily hydrolase (TIGR01509 family)
MQVTNSDNRFTMKAPLYRCHITAPKGSGKVPRPLAFIFDMDGVIVDSTDAHVEAWRRYLSAHDLEIHDILGRMLGKHNDEIVKDFFGGTPLSAETVARHGACKEKIYRDILAPEFDRRMVPGVREFLDRHKDVPAGLATNAEPANVEFVLRRAGIAERFLAVVKGDEVARPKPAPDIYLRASTLLGVPPRRCVVFEDSITGTQAALAAGMRVVGIASTLGRIDGVDLLVSDFNDPGLELWLRS